MQLTGYFSGKRNKLLQGFKYIRVYIDGLLVLTTGNWTNHLTKSEQLVIKLQEKGLKYNIENSSFGQS